MKILLINNIFYRKGGSETVFFNSAELLSKAGNEVRLFSIENPLNCFTEQKAYFAPQLSGAKRAVSYFYNTIAARRLDLILDEWHPDIAHIHLIWGGLSPSIIKILHKHSVPVVHTVHDYRLVCPAYTFRNHKGEICENCRKTYIDCIFSRCSKGSVLQSSVMALEMRFRNMFHYPVKNIDGFIFVSRFSLDKHIEHDRNYENVRSLVLHNCTKPVNTEPSSGYFLFSGRLSQEKGCYNLVRAFRQNPDFKLVITGTGSEEKGLRELARDCSNIRFTGHLDKESLFKLIALCSYVIVPSEWYENNPMSIIEAYAASKPVIGARIGGIPEIVVEGKTGFLFEAGNLNSLCNVLEMCPKDNTEEYQIMCGNAYQYFQKEFSENMYLDKLIHFYNTVVNEN